MAKRRENQILSQFVDALNEFGPQSPQVKEFHEGYARHPRLPDRFTSAIEIQQGFQSGELKL